MKQGIKDVVTNLDTNMFVNLHYLKLRKLLLLLEACTSTNQDFFEAS